MMYLITIIASIIFGFSNLYLIPVLIPFCLAWIFYASDKSTQLWKVVTLALLFGLISSFIADYPLIESFQNKFSLLKPQGILVYSLTTIWQSLPLIIGLITAFLFNKYFVSRQFVRHLTYAVFCYVSVTLFPSLLNWKMSYSLLKYKVPVIQFADTIGFSGLDLLIFAFASFIVYLFVNRVNRLEKVLSLIIIVTLLTLGGVWKKTRYNKKDIELNTLSVQTSLSPYRSSFSLDKSNVAQTMQINFTIIKENITADNDLIIFPEAEVPFFYNDPKASLAINQFSSIVAQGQIPLITGVYYLDKDVYFNSSVLIHKDGSIAGYQNAKHLIPILEKQKMLVDLRGLTHMMSDLMLMESKEKNQPLILKKQDKEIKILTLSNSDALSNQISQDFNPDFLVAMSNDELLRTSDLLMKKYNWAILSKAVEMRKPMVHSSHFGPNTAITSSGIFFGTTDSGLSTALNTSLNVKLDQAPTIYSQIQIYEPYAIFIAWIIFSLISSVTHHRRPEAYFEN